MEPRHAAAGAVEPARTPAALLFARGVPGDRRPGPPPTHPAWGVAVFAVVGVGLFNIALLLQSLTGELTPTVGMMVLSSVVGGGYFVVLARTRSDSWRPWMTHAGVLTGNAFMTGLVLFATSELLAVLYSSLFTWPIVFAGLYFPTRSVVLHVLLLGASCSTALTAEIGTSGALTALAVTTPVYAGITVICTSLAQLLRTQAGRDELTGLLNRRGLEEAADRSSEHAARSGSGWSVVAIDLDGFKQVNDRHGHQAGDDLLVEVARGWTGELRRHDVLARTGGDEFVVLLPGGLEEAVRTVARLRERTPPEVGVSAGVAPWSVPLGLDAALRQADAALYSVKRTGRGRTALAGSADSYLDPA
ncbi:diguanylate cyclase [Modestobacter sp. I12A-02628]|uniref:GGDEF domain-containing protein n=1 Tax=Goekera deserti TaxID=2497753 RepID=A0A7K3WLZ0_9ACTN|nr:GGDEF domain-containing protein [Goekera deserti]MPR00511.1 diguanylate cyclase [Goekera deserti]NDI50447.1 diguanylate cyclase [Goekera deserti]NEL56543.1 GGDEF domain-containing protein [Goekera deserti]